MAANYIKVNSSVLRRDANELKDMAIRAQRLLDDSYQGIEALDRMWDGPANSVFVKQFKQDYAILKTVINSVSSFSNDMGEAAKEYERCENNVERSVASIRI